MSSLNLIEGLGIEGDRHARAEKRNQVLVMDVETLDEFELRAGDIRENIATRGLDVADLTEGDRLRFGVDAEVLISHPCAPCYKMDALRPGLQQEIDGRRGMLAVVTHGGVVLPGDVVKVTRKRDGDDVEPV
ncbi:MAG: MOSC domain-containing protein [Chloroflexi bacterium]|nr:MOSC domain-containing protein [Chloroflexota bacterium]